MIQLAKKKSDLIISLAIACVFAMMLIPQTSHALETKGRAALKACALQYKVALPLPQHLDKTTKEQLKTCVIARGYMPAGYKKKQEELASCLSKEGITLPEGARTPADDQTKEAIRQCKEHIKKHT